MDLSDFRKQYTKGQLLASEVPPNPIILFRDWFDEVQSKGKEQETNAMTLSTQQPGWWCCIACCTIEGNV